MPRRTPLPPSVTRVDRMWNRGRDWVVTAAMAIFGFLLAFVLVEVDDRFQVSPSTERLFLYSGDAGSASTLLAAIAGATITVAGVIFSANFVTMQLASSSYTPRIIRTLTRKRNLQSVLGVFVGTFVYAIMVLRATTAETASGPEFVPVISVTVAMLLALISVGALVFFVHYGTKTMQPAFLIGSAAQDSIGLIAGGAPTKDLSGDPRRRYPGPVDEPSSAVVASHWGYVQYLNPVMLGALAERLDLIIRIDVLIGEAVLPGESIVTIWPASALDEEITRQILDAYEFGDERTPEQDIEFGFQRVQDIALKALSPAINDPTTARWCIDRLGDMLVMLGRNPVNPYHVEGALGQDRILWNDRLFERCVDISFTQIRYYGSGDPVVVEHLLGVMRRITLLVPPSCVPYITAQAQLIREQALARAPMKTDRDRIERAAQWSNLSLITDGVQSASPSAKKTEEATVQR